LKHTEKLNMIQQLLRGLAISLTAITLIACGSGNSATKPSTVSDLDQFFPANRPAVFGGSTAYSNCVILTGNTVKCWGYNDVYGVLGIGSTDTRGDGPREMGNPLPAVNLGTGLVAKQLAVGTYNICALMTDGRVKCWGWGGDGLNGQGTTYDIGYDASEMGDALPFINLGTGRTAKMLSLGYLHACALLDNNSVKCWGLNKYGQLGLGDSNYRGDGAGEMGDNLQAVNLGTGRTAKYVMAGGHHTCAHLDNDTVKCWGYNNHGQLGLGDANNRGDQTGEMGDSLLAVDLGRGRTVKQLSVGSYHSCALLDNNSIKCWGVNSEGQLGLGDRNDRGDGAGEMGDALLTVNLGTARTAKWVLASGYSTCAMLDNNTVKCWGDNSEGQLGLGDTNDRGDAPNEMGDNLPALNFGAGRSLVQMSGGELHFCAAFDNNTVKCWGDGEFALGQGNQNDVGRTSANDIANLPAIVFTGVGP
jgi:alpha-tubulin suppressor-like RCC1 family protein